MTAQAQGSIHPSFPPTQEGRPRRPLPRTCMRNPGGAGSRRATLRVHAPLPPCMHAHTCIRARAQPFPKAETTAPTRPPPPARPPPEPTSRWPWSRQPRSSAPRDRGFSGVVAPSQPPAPPRLESFAPARGGRKRRAVMTSRPRPPDAQVWFPPHPRTGLSVNFLAA